VQPLSNCCVLRVPVQAGCAIVGLAVLILAVPGGTALADSPAPFPLGRPQAAEPQPPGDAWLAAEATGVERRGAAGLQITRSVGMVLRLDEESARSTGDITWQVLPAGRSHPAFSISSLGLGAPNRQRTTALALGWTLPAWDIGAGLAVNGSTPFATLRWLPDSLPLAFGVEVGRVGALSRPRLSMEIQPLPWLQVGLGLEGRNRAFVGLTLRSGFESVPRPSARPATTGASGPGRVWVQPTIDEPMARAIGRAAGNALMTADTDWVTVDSLDGLGLPTLRSQFRRGPLQALADQSGSLDELSVSSRFSVAPEAPLRWTAETTADLLTQFGPGPPGSGWLHRSVLDVGGNSTLSVGRISLRADAILRLNLDDSLSGLPAAQNKRPIRCDSADYASSAASPHRLAGTLAVRPWPELTLAGSVGLLEETLIGTSSAFLWQQFDSRWSLAGDGAVVWKRPAGRLRPTDPKPMTSGFLTLRYETPEPLLTTAVSIGRFLDGGYGAVLGLSRWLSGGIHLSAEATLAHGFTPRLRVTVPFGTWTGPIRSRAVLDANPVGFDHGQRLDPVVNLYDFRYRAGLGRLVDSWTSFQLYH
jgi:hypothetical protein